MSKVPAEGLYVARVGHAAAEFAVRRWHYSGTLPVPPRVLFGVWEDGAYIGVVIYSRGASPDLGRPYGLSQTECCELTRVALTEHAAPVSQIVAETLRSLRATQPGIRLVVSFADPHYGHHGGIYQAGNWVYLGESPPGMEYRDRSGKRWHPRQVSETGLRKQFGEVRRVPRPSEMTKVKTPGKHRYVMPLDKQMRRAVTKRALPYPAPQDVGAADRD